MTKCVAYYRTSSMSGVGDDKDSKTRQQSAVKRHALLFGMEIVAEFYDDAVKGADPLEDREEFGKLLDFIRENDIKVILFETVNRLARDVTVQLTGYQYLKNCGVRLVPVDDPKHFDNIEDNPMAEAIMIIMATLSMLDKKMLCKRMRSGIEKKRRETGRCEGRKPVPQEAIEHAVRMRNEGKTLRQISDFLAVLGYRVVDTIGKGSDKKRVVSDRAYAPQSIKKMLEKAHG